MTSGDDASGRPPRSRGGRTILIVVGVIALLGLIGGGAAFFFTQGATKAADAFFALNATKGNAAAWATATPGFRASTPLAAWTEASRVNGLATYRDATWSERNIAGSTATIAGTLATGAATAVPVSVTLVKADDAWRVQSVQFAAAGLQPPAAGSPGTTAAAAPPMVPGAAIAAGCRTILATKANVMLDDITCPPMAGVNGAVAQCAVRKGAATGTMRVTLSGVGDPSGQADLDCKVDAAVHR